MADLTLNLQTSLVLHRNNFVVTYTWTCIYDKVNVLQIGYLYSFLFLVYFKLASLKSVTFKVEVLLNVFKMICKEQVLA